jgi:hypothetical protein
MTTSTYTHDGSTRAGNCSRCKIKAPPNNMGMGWALPLDGGMLCPACYGKLQNLRRRVNKYAAKAMNRFMRSMP